MTSQDPKTRAKELADAHWDNYNAELLTLAGVDPFVLKLCAYIYKSAGCHFYKHAVEDMNAGLFRKRIGDPLTAEEVDDITASLPSGCQRTVCEHYRSASPCNCKLFGMAGPSTCDFYMETGESSPIKAGADNCANYDPKRCVDCYQCASYERETGEIIAPPSATIEEVCGILADRAVGDVSNLCPICHAQMFGKPRGCIIHGFPAIPPDPTPIATLGPLDLSLPSITLECTANEAWEKYCEEWSEVNAASNELHRTIEVWDCLQALQTYVERGGKSGAAIVGIKGELATIYSADPELVELARRSFLCKNAARWRYSDEVNAAILASSGHSWTVKGE